MNLLFTALLMLCGLGTAIFATTAARKRGALAALGLGFATGAVLIRPDVLPNASWTGGIVAGVAALQIFRPDVRFLAPLCGGALAAMWSALLQIQGLPPVAALILAGIVPALSAYLSGRREAFAPESLREEAMLALVVTGLVVAMIPEVSAGWRSALALNREEESALAASQFLSGWVLVLSAASVVLGGLYSLLRRR